MILISIHAPPRGATGQRQKGFSSRSHFNSRPSARGDDAADKGGMLALQFQFTPLREGRLAGGVDKISKNEISIHAPPRGATSPPRWTPWPPTYFNSRPSARGDSQQQRAPQPLRKFQFTPLREGRRRLSSADGSSDDISIHAPPRGATPHDRHLLHLMAISIHAPPRGATHHQGKRSNYSNISIHAPPRGATTPSIRKSPLELFQFTPLREGRHTQPPPLLIHQNISIHAPPRGATRKSLANFICFSISIHAPPRGATGKRVYFSASSSISIHAPPRGATALQNTYISVDAISIHAPPRGATLPIRNSRALIAKFQFTPLREGRPWFYRPHRGHLYKFQFTPLREGRLGIAGAAAKSVNFNSRPSARGDARARNAPDIQHSSIHAPPRGATLLRSWNY